MKAMQLSILPRSFYRGPTLRIAKSLLGKILVHHSPDGLTAGKIVETEGYLSGDPACHAVRPVEFSKGGDPIRWETKLTRRNRSMFGPPGHAYVYFTYGNHHCLNVVTRPTGTPEAVLIRALEPTEGIEFMKERRGLDNLLQLTSGPGKLTQAMGITRELDGADLTQSPLIIAQGEKVDSSRIITTTRVGIRQATQEPWRFYLAGNPWVSRK